MQPLQTAKHRALRGLLSAAILCLSGFSAAALAEDVRVVLGGDNEVPAVKTAANGAGTITINPDMSVSGSVSTSGIEGTMAHIHAAAAGKNGPVIIPLTKSGDGWAVPPGAKLSEAQYKEFKAGDLYVNVHSAAHKGGEIRGQLKP